MILTWTGSDVLFATSYPKHSKKSKYIYFTGMRIFAKIADKFVQKHIVVSEHLIEELKPLKLKKPIEVRKNPVLHHKYPKQTHSKFNVLFYYPRSNNPDLRDWIYGVDILEEVLEAIPKEVGENMNLITVGGKQDMSKVYPIIDYMIRCNRHDGNPRMVRECIINNIPYYHSYSNPMTHVIYEDLMKHYAIWRRKNIE